MDFREQLPKEVEEGREPALVMSLEPEEVYALGQACDNLVCKSKTVVPGSVKTLAEGLQKNAKTVLFGYETAPDRLREIGGAMMTYFDDLKSTLRLIKQSNHLYHRELTDRSQMSVRAQADIAEAMACRILEEACVIELQNEDLDPSDFN